MRSFKTFSICTTFVLAINAQATPITIGDLLSNDDWTTSVISDSSRGIEYLRLDGYRSLNYEEIVLAIEPGGGLEGWQIANEVAATKFIDALLGVNSCATSPYFAYHCTGTNNMTATQYGQLTGAYIYDRFNSTGFAYLTNYASVPIGVFRPFPRSDPVVGFDIGPIMTIATYDRNTYYYGQSPAPLLLYRSETNFEVPEPNGLALFGTILVALITVSRRRHVSLGTSGPTTAKPYPYAATKRS